MTSPFVQTSLALLLMIAPASSITSVTVDLHEDAVLPCHRPCSGLITWTVFNKPHDILAQCNQGSCQSQEGFQMPQDQYMKGNFSLMVKAADYSKMNWYTCDCDGKGICDVNLRVKPLNVAVTKKPGESLELELPISEPVSVTYNRPAAGGLSKQQICRVEGRSLQCIPEYAERASVILQIKNITEPGVYNIEDIKNGEVLHINSVNIQDEQGCKDQASGVPVWVFILTLILVMAVEAPLLMIFQKKLKNWRKNRQNAHGDQSRNRDKTLL